MSLSPKQFFLEKTDQAKRHQDTVDKSEFIEAAQAALLQLVASLPDTSDPVQAAALYHRVVGARSYLNGLLTIADKSKPIEKQKLSSTLNYDT